jgi:hypothetical protein
MALTGGNVGYNQGGIPGFPQTGPGTRETREERNQRLEAEDRKNEALNDPYGLRNAQGNPQAQNADGTTRVVRKKIRVKRNTGQTEGSSNGSNGTSGTGRNRESYAQTGPNSLLNRTWNGQSSLVRASVLFKNNQAQNPQQNQNQLQTRNKMLTGLNQYINNDYQMMKLNPDDKSFTYRTAEARQLTSTIGQMLVSTNRQTSGGNKKSGSSSDSTSTRLSPEAFGRQKTLLRRLSAMSDPNPQLPDNLPTDYRPFESVA